MERCSYFIPNKALFGSFPDQEQVDKLEALGVRCFIDLTDINESNTIPYKTRYKYIKYPIQDRKIPENWRSFAQLIVVICQEIDKLKSHLLFIHCRGGHSRSGMLVASVLAYYYGLKTEDALAYTSQYHSERPEMREKWRYLGSPNDKHQKDFVHRFFKPLRYENSDIEGFTVGFNNFSRHAVNIPEFNAFGSTTGCTFPNAHLAFQAYRDPTNKEYIRNLLSGKFSPELIRDTKDLAKNWEENKLKYMYKVLDYKFRQHYIIRNILMNTGLRPLIKVSHDKFWGNGGNDKGKNIHGKLLERLRTQLLCEDFNGTL